MGWKTILSYPTSDINLHSLFKIVIWKEPQIKTSPIIGIIVVQFLPNNGVPLSVRNASSHYLHYHSNVRNIAFEHGVMVPAEKRFDPCNASILKYLPTRNKGKKIASYDRERPSIISAGFQQFVL